MIRKCGQCGSRNDPKRVICKDCGARLPDPEPDGGDPVVAPANHQPPPPVFKGGRKEYAKLKTVRPRHPVRNALLLLMLACVAIIAWAGSKVLEPVPGLNRPVISHASTVDHVRESLAKSAVLGRGSWVGEVGALNQVLAEPANQRVIFQIAGMQLRFQRSYLEMAPGTADLIMVLDAHGREIVCRLSVEPVPLQGGSGIQFIKASVGGLQLPSFLAGFVAPLWTPCIDLSWPIIDAAASAQQIEITPKAIILKWEKSSP